MWGVRKLACVLIGAAFVSLCVAAWLLGLEINHPSYSEQDGNEPDPLQKAIMFGLYGRLSNNIMQIRNVLYLAAATGRVVAVPYSLSFAVGPFSRDSFALLTEIPPDVALTLAGCVRKRGLDEDWEERLPRSPWVDASIVPHCATVDSGQQLIDEISRLSGPVFIPEATVFNMYLLLSTIQGDITRVDGSCFISPLLITSGRTAMIDMFGDDAIASGSVLCAHLRLGDFAEGPTSALRLLATLALRIRKTAASRNSTALLFLTDGDGADAEFLMAIAGITPSFHGCVSNGRPCSVPTSIGEEQLSNFIAVREQAMCAHAGTFLGSITYSTFSGLIRDLHADVGGLTTDVFDIHVPPLGGLPVFDILDAKIVTLETFYPSEPVAPLVSFSAALSPLGAFHVENSTDWTVFPPSANGSTPVDPLGSGAYSTLGFNRLCVDTNSSFVLLSSRSPSTSLSRDSFILEAGGWWRVLPIEEVVEHAVWPPVVPLFLPSCGLVDVVPKLFGVLSSLTSRGLPLPSLVLASTVTVCESSAMRAVLTEFHITCSVPESLLTNLPYACFANSTLQTCEPPLLQSHNHSVAFANLVRKHLGVTLSRPVSRTIHIMDLETQFDDVGGIRDFLNRSSGGLPLLPPLPQSASEGDLVSRLSNTGVTIALCPSLLSHAPFLSPGSVLLLLVTNGCSETVARAAVMAGATVVTYPLLDGVEVRNTSRVRLSLPRFASVYGPVIAKFFCDTETNLDLRRGCA